ncbi:hypothetical protein I5M27_05910 [Adhaeribacter sp. BT258]|uniref:Transporter n=1 Tax=Adhaeribacter terrigena TaxID=2793070 RepID=A0ABS1BZF5_9BACT|nr:hypothetical protein [Adhaeribacter terrigena]MBK0402512.1 hypothetical protein [Adhaeribacter terrigena]
MKLSIRFFCLFFLGFMLTAALKAQAQTPDSTTTKPAGEAHQDLAIQLQNPVASLISVPFQSNHDYGFGDNRGYKHTLNFQPVIPVSAGKNWNMIVRVILPIIDQNDVIGDTEQDGIGDIINSYFFTPKKMGKLGIIWGVGPAFLIPTASEKVLGAEKFGLGPTIIVLKQTGPYTFGILSNQIWSVAGANERADVSSLFFQPFISHTNKSAFTVSLSGENTYDWKAEHLNGAVILGISQLVKYHKQPISFGVNGKTFFGPEGAPDWGWRFVATFLFPTGGKKK